MGFLLTVALAVLLFPDPGVARSWQWQRVIEPAATSPAAEQCVVLDASLYANAAPGLRDVRLLQDGREIAYAVQESYDEHSLGTGSGLGAQDDRSLYTTVLRIDLTHVLPEHAPGSQPILANESGLQQGGGVLPAHVPVERMVLVPQSTGRVFSIGRSPQARQTPVWFRFQAAPGGAGPASMPVANSDDVERSKTNSMQSFRSKSPRWAQTFSRVQAFSSP